MIVDGRTVEGVEMVASEWHAESALRLPVGMWWAVVGRAEVRLQGGGRSDGLVLQAMREDGAPAPRSAGLQRVVVVWERSTRMFRGVPL